MTDLRQDRIQSFAYVISVFFCICLFGFFIFNPVGFHAEAYSSKPGMENRINPNEASMESLIRLPGVGPVRAAAIVQYRQKFLSENPDETAFENLTDLQKINGIGPKTAETISQWLKFE
jgi:competence protein ComEA